GRRARPRAGRGAGARRRALDGDRRHRRPAARDPTGGSGSVSRKTSRGWPRRLRRTNDESYGLSVRITGVIQAGGRSTRMGGEPKALLELGGKRIVERVVDALGAVLADLLVVTNTPERYAFLGLPMVADRYPDGGALGG